MAIARKCDRCGSLYETYDGMMLCTHLSNSRNREYDLCPDCMMALLSFLSKPDPKMVLDFMKNGDMDSIKKAFELRNEGKSLDEIAKELGYNSEE